MFKKYLSTNRVLMAGVFLMIAAVLVVLPALRLPPADQTNFALLLVSGIVYSVLSNRAAAYWGWDRLAPIIQPLNVFIVTLAFSILYDNVNLVWTFYFIIPLSAALIVGARWAFVDGLLIALAYLFVEFYKGGLDANLGEHLLVAAIMLTFALFGGTLAAVLRQQQLFAQTTANKLTESENRFKRMAEQAEDMIFRYRLTPPRGFEYVNSAVSKISGFTAEEIAAAPNLFLKRMHPDDRQVIRTLLNASETHPNVIICRWYHKDGRMLWLESHNVPIYNSAGKLIAVEGILRDITQNKQFAEALQDKVDALQQVTISQTQLITETRARATQLSTLNEISYAVSTLQSLDNVFQVIYEQTQRVIPLDAFFIGLYDPASSLVNFPLLYDEGIRYQKSTLRLNPDDRLGQTILVGKPILINRTAEQMTTSTEQLVGNVAKRSAALIYAPLIVGERTIGVISAQSYQFNTYTSEHLDLLTGVAHQAAIAIENARLLEAERAQLLLSQTLQEIGKLLTAGMGLSDVLESILDLLGRVVQYDSVSIQLLDTSNTLHLIAGRGFKDFEKARQLAQDLSASIISRKYATIKAVVIPDTHHDDQWIPIAGSEYIRSWIGAPLIVKGKMIGVLNVDNRQPNAYDEHIAQTVMAFADQAAIAIENARLFDDADQRANAFASLYENTRDLAGPKDVVNLLQTITERAMKLLGAPGGGVYLYDGAHNDLELKVALGQSVQAGSRLAIGEGMAGRVAQSRQPMIIDDYRYWEHRAPIYRDQPIMAVVQVPMEYHGELIGVLAVHELNNPQRRFTEADARLLALFASQAASAVHSARLLEETHHRADEFVALYEISRDLTGVQNLDALLQTIVQRAISLLRVPGGGMYLFDNERQELEVVVTTHPSTPVGTRLKIGEGMAGRVATTRQPLIVDDYRTWYGRSPQFEETPLAAVLEVPMLYRGELIGVLVVEEIGDTPHKFTEDDARLLSLFAAQAAGVVHGARLYESTRQRTAELEAVRQASLSLTSTLDLSVVLHSVAENVMHLNPDAHDIHIYLHENQRLKFGTSLWADGKKNDEWSPPRPDGLTYTVAHQGKTIVVNNMRAHPLFANIKRIFDGAIVGLPLKAGDRVVGVMNIAYDKPRTFSDDVLNVLQLIGDQAAIAIENARLHYAMQDSEQRYRSLVENLPIAVYRVTPGPQGEFVMANPAYLKMFGFDSLEELNHYHVSELYINPSERQAFSERVVRDGYIIGLEQHLKRKDDTPIWALVNARAVYAEGKVVGFDCTAIDITARKLEALARMQAEQALKKRSMELEGLLQTSTTISAYLDLERVLTVIAEQARGLLHSTEATVFLFDEKSTVLRPIVALGEYETERLALTLHPGEGVVGWVAEHRLPAIINNALNDARVKHVPGTPEEEESILAAPLIHAEQLQGVVMINRIPASGFSQSELDLLNGLAAQASTAIVNARLFEETRRAAQEQHIVSEIARVLNANLDILQAFPDVVRGLRTLVNCDRISLAMLTENRESFTMVLLDQPHQELAPGTQLPVSATAAALDILAGRIHLTDDLSTEFAYPAERILFEAGYRSRVNLPLLVGDHSIGALNLASQRTFGFSNQRLPVLQQIADLVAIAMENTRLFRGEQTRRNELSALYELSRSLTNTTQVESIVDLVVRHAVHTIQITFARLLLKEKNQYVVRAAFPIRVLGRKLELGKHLLDADFPFCEQVLCDGKSVAVSKDDPRLGRVEHDALFLDIAETLYLIPLCIGEHGIGLLTLGEQRNSTREPLTPDKIRLAHSIGDQAANALHRAELYNELENAYLQTVLALANAVDAKDSDTNTHSRRLANFAMAVGRELGLGARTLEDIHYGAILHDIGKIGVPDAVLKKPSRLEPDEWQQMYQHPIIGSKIIAPLPRLAGAAAIVRHHHERFDGKGYPDGLAGEAIPLGARILTIVDSYGAMIDQRVYKPKRTHEEAIAELKRNAGTQFDPGLLQVFLRIIELERANEQGT